MIDLSDVLLFEEDKFPVTEVKNALKTMKNGRAPGPNGLSISSLEDCVYFQPPQKKRQQKDTVELQCWSKRNQFHLKFFKTRFENQYENMGVVQVNLV